MEKKAMIFDLDGVIVTTDNYHYKAWKQMADDENIYFDRKINERLRGVSRMQSLEIILERATKTYTEEEKVALATKKNEIYKKLIGELTEKDILPGVLDFLKECKKRGIMTAIGSSSKNAPFILERIGLIDSFDTVVDGTCIKHSKPDPEVFVLARERLGADAKHCIVVEDAYAGIDAATAGNMRSLAVSSANDYEKATYRAENLADKKAMEVLDLL